MPANGRGLVSDRYVVHSLTRAISVLELIAEKATSQGGLRVTDIAAGCGMSKSATFAILQTLQAGGLVADDGEGQGRRYRLGITLARLGDCARGQLPLHEIAKPALQRLAGATRLPARLAVLDGNHALVVEQVAAPRSVQVQLRMWSQEALYNTGLGKAILAHLTDEEVRARLDQVPMVRETRRTITDVDALMNNLKTVRKAGYAVDDEESVEGIFCVGSGVRDHTGASIGAVSVTGLKAGSNTRRYRELGAETLTAAEAISVQLGWQAPTSTTTVRADDKRPDSVGPADRRGRA